MIFQNKSGIQGGDSPVYNQRLAVMPNGEIVYRYSLPPESKKKDSRELKDIQASQKRRENEAELLRSRSIYKFELHLAWFLLKKICGVGVAIAPEFEKTNIKPGWGLLSPKWKNFTQKAKRQLRYGAGAMEREFGIDKCFFATLTLPGSTNEATRVIAQWSGYIMNRIQTWIGDNFVHSDGKKYVIGVVELQKRGALHWHFLVALESFFYYEKFAKALEEFWYNILCELSEKSGVNLFKSHYGYDHKLDWQGIKDRAVRTERVKKSVSNYLAKYISKNEYRNVTEVVYKSRRCKVYPPSAWYARSEDVIKLITKHTILLPLHPVAPSLLDEIFEFTKDIFNSFGFWTVEILNPFTKQKVGVLARGKYEDAREACEVLAPIINEVCTQCRQDVDRSYKQHHSEGFKLAKEQARMREESDIIEYIDAQGIPYFMRRRSQTAIHKQYWNAIKSGHAMQEAFAIASMD